MRLKLAFVFFACEKKKRALGKTFKGMLKEKTVPSRVAELSKALQSPRSPTVKS